MKTKIDSKPTNPKDLVAITKLGFGISPTSVEAFDNLAGTEGRLKYGMHNWRIMGVRASVYYSAARRHLEKYWNGEWADKRTKIPHLISARFCLGIIFDSHLRGNLTDDRPPSIPGFSDMIDELEDHVKHLQRMFKDHHPYQYSIGDTKPYKPGKQRRNKRK